MGKKSELRNYASYGGKIFSKNLSYVITPVTVTKFWGKNLSYVITPVTVTKFWGKKLNYVITPGLKKNSGKNPNYAIT